MSNSSSSTATSRSSKSRITTISSSSSMSSKKSENNQKSCSVRLESQDKMSMLGTDLCQKSTSVQPTDVTGSTAISGSKYSSAMEITSKTSVSDEDHLNPLLVELKIERERISLILESAIKKLHVALALPYLLQNNGSILKPFLTSDELDVLNQITKKYISLGIGSQHTLGREKNSNYDAVKFDPELSEILEILYGYPQTMTLANEFMASTSEVNSMFVRCMHVLKNFTLQNLVITAQDERTHEQYLQRIWQQNEEAKKNIFILEEKLLTQRRELQKELDEKLNIVQIHNSHIEKINSECNDTIHTIVWESNRSMADDWRVSFIKQDELINESKNMLSKYETLLENHLRVEKDVRVKRTKIESQLLSWIQKYDSDMNDRQNVFDEYLIEYDNDRFEYDEIQSKYEDQDAEYVILMEEKRAYLQMLWEKKVDEFIKHTAAKHIQRWFRAYLKELREKRKKLKKMLAKGKK